MRLLLLLCACLVPALAFAQTTISGRVTDAKSNDWLPGVTVLQTATTNGTSSDAQGYFTLTLPNQPDSVALTVSSLGYLTQRLRVAPGGPCTIQLVPDTRTYIADAGVLHYPFLGIGLTSGTRYAPFGVMLLLDGRRSLRLPISATGSYQTNFSENHSLAIGVRLPPIHEYGRVTINEGLEFQQLQAAAPKLQFSSYVAATELHIYRIGQLRMPTLLLGIGYGRLQPLQPDAGAEHGYGIRLGLHHELLSYPLRLFGTVQATRWPTFWQWQGRLAHPFADYFQAGIEANYLRQYAEFSLTVSRYFY